MAGDTIDVEVVVVGAGPTGLVAALALARAGARVALVAPRLPPAPDHRTTALLSGTVDVLDRLGAWAGLRDVAAPLKAMRLVDGTKRLMRAPEVTFHASELGLDAFGFNVANRDLLAALAGAVSAADSSMVRVETVMTSARVEDGRVHIETEGGGMVSARLAVAADGRKSMLRDAAGIKARTWTYPQTALVLNLDHTEPHFDTSTEFHTETGPFTLVPLAANRSSLVCVEKPATAEALAALDDTALALELERRCHSMLGALSVASPRQTWPLSSLSVASMVGERIALVGETAHAFPPIGAQGLNLGIRDVATLAEIIGRARTRGADVGSEETLSRYASARRTDVMTRTFGVDLLNRSLLTGFLPVQLARAVGLQLARDVGPLRKLLMREGMRPRLFAS